MAIQFSRRNSLHAVHGLTRRAAAPLLPVAYQYVSASKDAHNASNTLHLAHREVFSRTTMDNEPISEETLLLDDLEGDTRNTARCKHIPRHISLRIGAAMYSFVILGLFQSSVGVMLQPLSEYYSLSDVYVSFVFVVVPVGYIIAAQFSDMIHRTYGQRGVAIFAPALHISGALVIASHPRFGIVLVAHATVALGLGLLDVSWCAWAASLENANLVSGLLQGAFSVGAAAGPFFASIVLRSYDGPWYDWYCILVSSEISNEHHSGLTNVARLPRL